VNGINFYLFEDCCKLSNYGDPETTVFGRFSAFFELWSKKYSYNNSNDGRHSENGSGLIFRICPNFKAHI
jgi:hypothetical protein